MYVVCMVTHNNDDKTSRIATTLQRIRIVSRDGLMVLARHHDRSTVAQLAAVIADALKRDGFDPETFKREVNQ